MLFTQRSVREILASQRAMLINRGEDPDKIGDAEMAATFRETSGAGDELAEQPEEHIYAIRRLQQDD